MAAIPGEMSDAEAREVKARRESNQKERFNEWLDQPIVKAMISMIPEGAQPDHVKIILQSAFESGFNAGYVNMAMEIMRRTTPALRNR